MPVLIDVRGHEVDAMILHENIFDICVECICECDNDVLIQNWCVDCTGIAVPDQNEMSILEYRQSDDFHCQICNHDNLNMECDCARCTNRGLEQRPSSTSPSNDIQSTSPFNDIQEPSIAHAIDDMCPNERMECKICFEKEIKILFLPCKHIIACKSCSDDPRIIECSYCQTRISQKIEIFIP